MTTDERIWFDNTTRVSSINQVTKQIDVYELGIRSVAALELEEEFAAQMPAIRLRQAQTSRQLTGAAA